MKKLILALCMGAVTVKAQSHDSDRVMIQVTEREYWRVKNRLDASAKEHLGEFKNEREWYWSDCYIRGWVSLWRLIEYKYSTLKQTER